MAHRGPTHPPTRFRDFDWTRVVAESVVASAYVALFFWFAPPAGQPAARARTGAPEQSAAIEVRILTAATPERPARTRRSSVQRTSVYPQRQRLLPLRHSVPSPRSALAPRPAPGPPSHAAPAATSVTNEAFAARLRRAQTMQQPPLPGGHQYTTQSFHFTPLRELSLEGRIEKYSSMLFGEVDPACKDAQRELAKPRLQQIADGYTPQDLKRIVREHCP